MANTRIQVRQEIYKRWPWLGFAAVADSIDPRGIVDASEFGRDRYSQTELQDLWAFRYNLGDPDRSRRVKTVAPSTGTILVDGTIDYDDQDNLSYELTGMNPTDLNNALQEAQRRQTERTIVPLGDGEDSDMELNNVDYWDGSLGDSSVQTVALEKDTDATDVFSGTRALKVTLTAAAGYVRGRTLRIPAKTGLRIKVGIIGRADTGTLTFRVYDTTNATLIPGATKSYTGEDWAYLEIEFTVPAGCEEIQYEFAGTEDAEVLLVDSCFGPFISGRRYYPLKSWVQDGFQVRFIRPSEFKLELSAGVYDVKSRVWLGDYWSPDHFHVESYNRWANAQAVQFTTNVENEELLQPLWVVAERSLFVNEPLGSETAATTADLDQVVANAQAVIAERLLDAHPNEAWFQQLVAETRLEAAVENVTRPPQARVRRKEQKVLRA
jgi:hypothetical protein